VVAGFTVDAPMRVVRCPFAVISMARSALDPGRPVRGGGDPVVALDASDPSVDRLCIFFLVNGEGNGFSIDLFLHILFPMAIHAEKDGGHNPFVAV
jgi:hypothetical protein